MTDDLVQFGGMVNDSMIGNINTVQLNFGLLEHPTGLKMLNFSSYVCDYALKKTQRTLYY